MEGQRPGSALAFPSLNAAPTPVSLPVVCRFVPHDQWFLTHLAPHWKGRDIKNHILAKCLNLTCTPPEPPTQYSLSDGATREQRPPSPITFAPVARARPPSPILFASIPPKPASTLVSSEEDDDSWDDDLSIIKSPSDGEGMSDDKGKGRLVDSDDSPDEDLPPQGGGRVLPTKVPVTEPNRIVPKLRPRASQKKVEDPKAVPQMAYLSFTLMRFSTGQTLEDEYPLSDHGFHPHELLELHLSFSPMRRESRSSTVIQATPNFPFPLLAPPPKQSRSQSKRKQTRVHEIIAAHSVRIIRLPRSSPQAYVLPYWEGWVRILRLVSRDPDEYYYASSLLNMPTPQGERKVVPGSPQYGTKLNGGWSHGHETGGEKRENSLDANLALNFGLSSKPKEHRTRDKQTSQPFGQDKTTLNPSFSAHQHHSHDRVYSRYEWRDRWLVVRDGWFFLLRDRSDTRPTHRYPLSLLYMLRGAERLTDAIQGSVKGNSRPREHSNRPADHNHHRSPPPPSSRETDRTPAPSVAEGPRSPSPTSTLKVARTRSPIQSGYGHGRHTLGRHTSRPSIAVTDEDAYEEDDERDRRELRTPTNKRPGTSSQHRHHHAHQHHHPQHRHGPPPHKPEGSRPRRDLTDPATRARLDRDTFIPDSKEEADLVGMKIMCARFYHPTSSGKSRIPDPFDGLQYDQDNSSINNRYTSTGPSLADVTVNIPSGLVSMGIVAVPEDAKDLGGRAKEIKAADNPKHKSRLMSKGSAPSSLSTDFGLPGMSKSMNLTADRRPSLPALMHGGEGLRSNTSVATGSLQTPLNAAANSSTTTLSFTSLFKSSKDKEDRRREKEAKKAAKAAKAAKRVDKERKEQDQDAPDATTSGGNWKISLPKIRKDARTPTSTLGHGEEEMLIISRHQEEASVGRNLEPPDAGRRLLDVDSDGSPEPSPVVFRPNPASEDGEEDDDDDEDDESIPHFNLNTFSPTSSVNADPSAIVHDGPGDAARADSGGDDSDSISISSPVFAREDGFEEDDEASELDFDLGLKQRRTGYRYGGYQKMDGSSKEPSMVHGSQPSLDEPSTSTAFSSGTAPSARLAGQGSPSTAYGSQAEAERPQRPDPQRHRARFEPNVRSSKRKHGEWIIMDFGNDAAFHSLLRILHRHSKELISSSFVDIDLLRQSSRPSSMSPRVPSDGISPLSPIPKDLQTNRSHPPSPNRGPSSQNSPVSSIRSRSHSDAPFNPLPRLAKSGPFSDDENDINTMRDSPASYQHPGPLYPRSKGSATGDDPTGILNLMPPGIGPYLYPEWRLQAVLRAKRAGLGQEGRPLELVHLAMNEQHSEFYRYNDPAFPRPSNPFRPVKPEKSPGSGAAEENESTRESGPEGAKDVDNGKCEEEGEEERVAREEEADDEQDDGDGDDDEEEQLVFTSESECSDDSELEWQTWTADLPRQYRQRRQRGPSPLWTVPPEFSPRETDLGEEDESDYGIPTTLEAENPTIMKHRRLKEPCGVVTSKYTSTALPGFVAQDTEHHDNEEHRYIHRTQRGAPASVSGATLSSPSSGESLAMKYQQTARPTTGNSVESSTASSPQSSQPHSRGHSHSVSHALPHKSSRASNRHSLLHSSSMQTNLRAASDGQGSPPDAGMRKVSMPVMGNTTTTVTEQTFTLNPNSFGMAIQELRNTHDNASIHSAQMPMSSSYGSSSHREFNASSSNDPFLSTESPITQHRVPSNVSLASGSQHHLRHQSSNFSVGRASNHSSSRPSVLRKHPSDREVERVRKLSNGPLPSSSSSSITPASPPKSPRPKLTVATSPQATGSFHQPRDAYDGPSPPFSPKLKTAAAEGSSGSGTRSLGRSAVRRMKSASSLKSGDEGGGGDAKGKKKKSNGTFGIFASAFP